MLLQIVQVIEMAVFVLEHLFVVKFEFIVKHLLKVVGLGLGLLRLPLGPLVGR